METMNLITLYFVPMIITFIYGVLIWIFNNEKEKGEVETLGFKIVVFSFIPIINILFAFYAVGMTIYAIVYLIVTYFTHKEIK